jgi:hypothetical protein
MSKEGKGAAAARKKQLEVADAELLTNYQLSLAQYRQRKRAKGDREQESLAKLRRFQARLKEGAVDQAHVSQDQGEKAAGGGQSDRKAYDGKLNSDIDHRAYMPASWRVRFIRWQWLLSVRYCRQCVRVLALIVRAGLEMGVVYRWTRTSTSQMMKITSKPSRSIACIGMRTIRWQIHRSVETTWTTTK